MSSQRMRVIQGHFAGGRMAARGPAIVQAKPAGGTREVFNVDLARLGVRTGGGTPLPLSVRQHAEALFHTDLANVRVHVGGQAAAIGAEAFTIGNDIYFAPGRFNVQQASGLSLIGHELAHVVQQRRGRVPMPAGQGAAVVVDHALEREADHMGMRLMALAGRSARPPIASAQPRLGPHTVTPRSAPLQAFWLRQGGTTTWQTGTVDTSRYEDSGARKWKYDYLPAFMNSELPVYRPIGPKKKVEPPKVKIQTPKKPTFDEDAFIAGQRDKAYEMGTTLNSEKWNGVYKKQFGAVWEEHEHKLEIRKSAFLDEMYDGFREGVKAVTPPPPVYPSSSSGSAPRRVETESEREARLERQADDEVRQILVYAGSVIGKYPVFTRKESLARVGCVKYGPAFEVSREVKALVYQKLLAMEGDPCAGCSIHIVRKDAHRQYNLTLHRNYRASNPQTQANIHVQ